MGVERFAAEMLIVARDNGCSFEKFATLGRQNIFLRPKEIEHLEALGGFKVSDIAVMGDDSGFADKLFERLGAITLHSLDYSDYQGCNVVIDLNSPIPRDREQTYDALFDGGTLEHVFHFPNAIANCMRLIKEGGWFFSVTGSNNWNGHGFYQFSPELFYRVFSKENGFEVKVMALGESGANGRLYRVEDGAELGHRVELNGRVPLCLVFAARRIDASVPIFEQMPYQSDYSASWDSAGTKSDSQEPGKDEETRTSGWLSSKVKALVRRVNPFVPLPPGVARVEGIAGCLR